jgi:hypothetical protein
MVTYRFISVTVNTKMCCSEAVEVLAKYSYLGKTAPMSALDTMAAYLAK